MAAQRARLTLVLADGEPACFQASLAARGRILAGRLAALTDADVAFDLACEALRSDRLELHGGGTRGQGGHGRGSAIARETPASHMRYFT
jgi:hypothetical protein